MAIVLARYEALIAVKREKARMETSIRRALVCLLSPNLVSGHFLLKHYICRIGKRAFARVLSLQGHAFVQL